MTGKFFRGKFGAASFGAAIENSNLWFCWDGSPPPPPPGTWVAAPPGTWVAAPPGTRVAMYLFVLVGDYTCTCIMYLCICPADCANNDEIFIVYLTQSVSYVLA